MDRGAAAEVAVARRKVKQAQDALRKAGQRLAAAERVDVFGEHTCTGPDDVEAVARLIRLALSDHDRVEVVVLT